MAAKFFFKGLNELRAIAALSVIFHHLELYSFREKRASLFNVPFLENFISNLGKNGVYLFFVLSGFLITYLLLKEKEQQQDVRIKDFYLRRVFRIWPLYFILFLVAFVFIPLLVSQTTFFDSETYYMSLIHDAERYKTHTVLLYLLLLSNFALPVVGASQSWSVSVEEQFYLIWPHLVKRFSRRKLLLAFIFLFVGILAYQVLHLPYYALLKKIPLEIMAIGGVFAYCWFYHKNILEKYFRNNLLFAANLGLLFLGLLYPLPKIFLAVMFGLLILFVITDRSINLRNKTLAWLGTISYGIYMYHPFMMFLSSAISNKFFRQDDGAYKILFYLLTITFTIAISYLSYHFIEKKLIAFKDKKFSTLK
ncbi:MAG TPA: acyltransferase [Flavobacterium sp.]|nr:acyltransferase [Flavobacterium sp.]